MTDLYADLGISRTASLEEVKKAHRRKAKETHPDKPGGSREKFAKVQRKKKGGLDLVKNLIDGMNAELHRNIARADEAISFHERALEIIAEYEFEFEKQQQVQFYATAVNSQTGSWFKL